MKIFGRDFRRRINRNSVNLQIVWYQDGGTNIDKGGAASSNEDFLVFRQTIETQQVLADPPRHRPVAERWRFRTTGSRNPGVQPPGQSRAICCSGKVDKRRTTSRDRRHYDIVNGQVGGGETGWNGDNKSPVRDRLDPVTPGSPRRPRLQVGPSPGGVISGLYVLRTPRIPPTCCQSCPRRTVNYTLGLAAGTTLCRPPYSKVGTLK